jgi:hypothetical protein
MGCPEINSDLANPCASNIQICKRPLNLEYGLLNRFSGFAF